MYAHLESFIHKRFNIDANYFLKGGFWLSLTQIIVIAAGVVTTALFAHYLSENDYGIYRYLIGIAAILSSFSLTGLGEAILQTAAKKYYNFYQETLKINFLYCSSITVVSIIGGIYYLYNENITLAIGCLLISFLQPFISSLQFIPVYLHGDGRYREATINQLTKTVIVSTASIIVLFQTNDLILLFTTYLAAQVLSNVLSYALYRKRASVETPYEIKKTYLRYAKHTSLRNAISLIANRIDTIIIFSSLGATQLAMYTIAIIVPEQLKGSMKNLTALLIPKYSIGNKQFSPGYIVKRSIQLFLLLSLITTIYIILAPYLYQVIFPKYTESVIYSQIFALGFPSLIFYIPYSILKVRLEENVLYKITLSSSIIQATLMLAMTIPFGIMGTVLSSVIYRYVLASIVYVTYFRSTSKYIENSTS